MRISQKILDECNTLEDLVEIMVTGKNGKRLNFSEIGETVEFIARFESFKEWLKEEIPNLTLEQILFIVDNQRHVVDKVSSWKGFQIFLTALEFEQRKFNNSHT